MARTRLEKFHEKSVHGKSRTAKELEKVYAAEDDVTEKKIVVDSRVERLERDLPGLNKDLSEAKETYSRVRDHSAKRAAEDDVRRVGKEYSRKLAEYRHEISRQKKYSHLVKYYWHKIQLYRHQLSD